MRILFIILLATSFLGSCAHLENMETRHRNTVLMELMDGFSTEANKLIRTLQVGQTKESDFKVKFDLLMTDYQLRLDEANAQFPHKQVYQITNFVISDSILKDGEVVNIYKFRTGRVPDGRFTEDEMTPVVFKDGILVNIGWSGFSE
tara:strand:- start:154 stop:594 length:441 start_codon:yes stop_codon:yes gene_type:complete